MPKAGGPSHLAQVEFSEYQLGVARTESLLSNALGRLARQCALRPLPTLVGMVAVLAAACCGVLTMTFDMSDNVWYDPNSNATQNIAAMESMYPAMPRVEKLLVYAKDGGSVFRKAVWDELFQLVADVQKIEVPQERSPTGEVCRFQDTCMSMGEDCLQEGVTGFFQHSAAQYQASVSSDADLLPVIRTELWPGVGGQVQHEDLFGGLELDESGLPAEAKAMRVSWQTTGDCASAWEEEFHRFFMGEQRVRVSKEFKSIAVQISTGISGSSEIERSVRGDSTTVYALFAVMLVVTIMVLGQPPCLPPLTMVRQRSLLASLELLLLAASIGAGYGVSFLCGIPFTLLAQVLPFVLLGVGIDSAFVISAAFDATDESEPAADRLEVVMGRVGVSITFTSLTDILAFGLGYLSRLPAVQYFCIMGIWCLLFMYIVHITAFVSLLALDARRQQENRFDILVCIKSSKEAPEASHSFSRRVMTALAEIVMAKTAVRVFVLMLFAASFGISMHTILNDMPTGFDLLDVAPDQSFLRDLYQKENEYFGAPSSEAGIEATVVFQQQPLDTAVQQALVFRTLEELQALPSIQNRSTSFWLADWTEYVERKRAVTIGELGRDFPDALEHKLKKAVKCLPTCRLHYTGEDMTASIKEWLSHDFLDAEKTFENGTKIVVNRAWGGKRFSSDIILEGDEIQSFRAHTLLSRIENSSQQVQAINEVEEFYMSQQDQHPGMKVVSAAYPLFDQNRIILPELLETFGWVCLAVILISPFILVHPLSVFIVALVVVMTFVNLFASLRLWGLTVNSVTGVILVCSIGLVVDYCAHICHSFSVQDPYHSRVERTVAALFEIGAPVAVGLVTTAVSIVPLAFAISETYRIFFRIGITMCVIGGLHGLVFCPVLLSFIGPALSKKVMAFHDGTERARTNIKRRTEKNIAAAAAKAAAACQSERESVTQSSIPAVSMPMPEFHDVEKGDFAVGTAVPSPSDCPSREEAVQQWCESI